MDYFKLIRKFWVDHDAHSLNIIGTIMFFYLLKVNNVFRWSRVFKRNNSKILADFKTSYDPLGSSCNKLKELGLIDFKTKNGSPIAIYSFAYIQEKAGGSSSEINIEVVVELNKTKTKTTTKTKTKANAPIFYQGMIEFSFDYEQLVKKFNQKFRHKLPMITSIAPKHKQVIRDTIELYGSNSVEIVFDNILQSPLLIDKNERSWKCHFDWTFQPADYIKILVGAYKIYWMTSAHSFTEPLNENVYDRF